MTANSNIQVPFDSRVSYRIQVQGSISPSWSNRLQGMDISHATSESGLIVTTLTGELPDQTALVGCVQHAPRTASIGAVSGMFGYHVKING